VWVVGVGGGCGWWVWVVGGGCGWWVVGVGHIFASHLSQNKSILLNV
jgi:hypothetical protein